MSTTPTHLQCNPRSSGDIELKATKTEARIDSRILADHLGNGHKGAMALIEKYRDEFKSFGQLPFQKAVGQRLHGGGNPERFALLNEDQAFFLLSLSRNSKRVVNLKAKLVQAFREARLVADQYRTAYLPTYHGLHDQIDALAAESSNRHHVHANINRLVNRAAGIEAGQRRAGLAMPEQAMLIVAQAVARNALQGAADHHEGYQRVKQCLHALEAVTALPDPLAAIANEGAP